TDASLMLAPAMVGTPPSVIFYPPCAARKTYRRLLSRVKRASGDPGAQPGPDYQIRLGRCSLVASGHAANREGQIVAHQRTNPVGATTPISLRFSVKDFRPG